MSSGSDSGSTTYRNSPLVGVASGSIQTLLRVPRLPGHVPHEARPALGYELQVPPHGLAAGVGMHLHLVSAGIDEDPRCDAWMGVEVAERPLVGLVVPATHSCSN